MSGTVPAGNAGDRRRRPSGGRRGAALLFSCLAAVLAPRPSLADVVINEIMYHPRDGWQSVSNVWVDVTNDTEYVELHNAGTNAVDLSTYRFDNGIDYAFAPGTVLATGAYLVVCASVSAFTRAYPAVSNYVGGFNGGLKNGGERVTLSRLEGERWVAVHTLRYDDIGLSDGEGRSLELVHPAFSVFDRTCPGAWAVSTTNGGTPGRVNSVFRTNAPPAVGEFRHDPPLPPAQSALTLTCRAAAREKGFLDSVKLRYRADQTPSAAYAELLMYDDGLNGDAVADDGIYTRMFPTNGAPGLANGTILEFRISATDQGGASSTSPASSVGTSMGELSYLVYIGEDAGFTGEYPTYHILMTQANRTSLETRGVYVDIPLDCTFITSHGDVYYNAGVRYRGGSSRVPPYNYRVELPPGDDYEGYGDLNLNHDKALHQYIGMTVMHRTGYGCLAPNVELCRLWLNETNKIPNQGVYVRIEKIGDIVDRHFPDTSGNIYVSDGDSYRGNLQYSNSLAWYATQYIAETNNPTTVWHELSNLCWIVDQAPASSWPEILTNRVNVRQWARHFATQVALDNSEAGIGSPSGTSGDEVRLYADPADRQFDIFPWDYSDLLYGKAEVWNWSGLPRLRNLLFNPPVAPYYIGDALDVMTNVMSDANMTALFDEMGSAALSLRAGWLSNVQSQRALLLARVSTNFTVFVSGGVSTGTLAVVVGTNAVRISGQAPQNYTARVRVNGMTAGWDPWSVASMQTTYGFWSMTNDLVLTGVVNEVRVETLDSEGRVLQTRDLVLVVQTNSTAAPGTLAADTVWSPTNGTVLVSGTLTVPAGVTLRCEPGAVVLFAPGSQIRVEGTLEVLGSPSAPVYGLGTNGTSWSLAAVGAGARIAVTNADFRGGQTTVSQGTLAADRVVWRDTAGTALSAEGGTVLLRRCRVSRFARTAFTNAVVDVAESLFESVGEAGLEFTGGTSAVSRTTISNATAGAVDGLRYLSGASGLASNNWIQGLSGAGLRVDPGAGAVRAFFNLVEGCATGLWVQSAVVVTNLNQTIAACGVGLQGTASETANSILWSNGVAVTSGPAAVSYTDAELAGTNVYPGPGNMNRTPWFRNPSAGDYRLLPISPCLAAASNGGFIGASFPVGATPAAPSELSLTNVLVSGTGAVQAVWRNHDGGEAEWVDVERSPDGRSWQGVARLPADATQHVDSAVVPGDSYLYRVRAGHGRGVSLPSEEAAVAVAPATTTQRLIDALRITEIMYNPSVSQDFEFLELKNTGADPLDLSGLWFASGIDFIFPSTNLPAGGFFVIVRNAAAFTNRYPGRAWQGVFLNGTSLDNGGERVRIKDAGGNTVLDLTYDDSQAAGWYPATDGGGSSLVLADPAGDPSEPGSWRASTYANGSPGADDPDWPYGKVLINEVLSHQDVDNPGDWIELYNPGTNAVAIGNWYLSDSPTHLAKFRIPSNRVIEAGGYAVFTEFHHFGTKALGTNGFALSESGESVYLSSGDTNGALTSYRTWVKFGAAEKGVTFGRYVRSDGEEDFPALNAATYGASNAYPLVGPVVINEIMYNPFQGGKEFVELFNAAPTNVPLFDAAFPANTWRFNGAMEYVFPTNTWIGPGQALVVSSVTPEEFRQVTGLTSASVRVYGPFAGSLNNAGDAVKLYKPGSPETNGFVPYVLVEKVQYGDRAPWPEAADNGGASLERRSPFEYANDPASWLAATYGGTPGSSNNTAGLPSVGFTVADGWGYETDAEVGISVSLLPACAATVTVHYAAAGGSATPGADYALSPGALIFWPYETQKTFPLRILDDGTAESDDTLYVALTNVSPQARLGGNTRFTYTIVDRDAASLAAPVILPSGGNFYTSVTVVVTSEVQGATVRYTLDGSIPTNTDPVYTAPLRLTSSARLTARTFLGSYTAGAWSNALFLEQTPPWKEARPTVRVRVSQSNDDAAQGPSRGSMGEFTNVSLAIGRTSYSLDNWPWVGFRFAGVPLEPGTEVTNAYVQFTAAAASNLAASTVIYGQAADEAPAFGTNAFNISSRPRTTNSVAWSPDPWTAAGAAGVAQRTPDLSGILNEVLARPGWVFSNSLALLFTNIQGQAARRAYSADGPSTNAPELVVRFVPRFYLSAATNGNGSILAGNRWVREGSNVTVQAVPAAYHSFGGWSGDIGGGDGKAASLTLVMDRNRSITGTFAADVTVQGVPHAWLALHYPGTNDFDGAAASDTDADGAAAWEEYFAGTQPTNAQSVLRIASVRRTPGGNDVEWLSVTTRVYSVHRSTRLADAWPAAPLTNGLPGAPWGTNAFTDASPAEPASFYQIRVTWP